MHTALQRNFQDTLDTKPNDAAAAANALLYIRQLCCRCLEHGVLLGCGWCQNVMRCGDVTSAGRKMIQNNTGSTICTVQLRRPLLICSCPTTIDPAASTTHVSSHDELALSATQQALHSTADINDVRRGTISTTDTENNSPCPCLRKTACEAQAAQRLTHSIQLCNAR